MSLPVLLLLSFLTVQCGGCDFDWEGVKHIKTTIDLNPTGFRKVFPKDYYVVHHYKKGMLCDTDPCCVFPAAVVLLDSWHVLLRNLYDEHLNNSFIFDLKQTLDKMIQRNKHTERFQEETDLSRLPSILSSPEDLLTFTSEIFSRWLKVGCSPSIETCSLPTLPPSSDEKEELTPPRARLLTTRSVHRWEEGQSQRKSMDITPLPVNSGPLSLSVPARLWSTIFILYWWLLP